MIKRIISLIFAAMCILAPYHSQAGASTGDYVSAPYMKSTVQITRDQLTGGQEYGFGFIVSQDNGKLYIVTANHVVRDIDSGPDAKLMPVHVRFYHDQRGIPFKAELLDWVNDDLDLALLRANIPSHLNWTPQNYCDAHQPDAYRPDDPAWFIGRAQKWFVPKDAVAGTIGTPGANRMLRYATNSVEVGTSGAPVISKKGLAGVIISDGLNSVEAVDVAIVKLFIEEGGYPWQLKLSCKENLPTLRVIPNVDNARIYIDGASNGEFSQGKPFYKRLEPRDYTVRVEKKGYFSFEKKVNLWKDIKIRINLKANLITPPTRAEEQQGLYEWQNDIRHSRSSRVIKEFLVRYPRGSHVPDAKRRLKELRARGR